MRGWHGSVDRRNALTMGITLRVAQFFSYAALKAFRDEMLQSLRFLMKLVYRVAELLVKEGFKQAVVANDFKRS